MTYERRSIYLDDRMLWQHDLVVKGADGEEYHHAEVSYSDEPSYTLEQEAQNKLNEIAETL